MRAFKNLIARLGYRWPANMRMEKRLWNLLVSLLQYLIRGVGRATDDR
jgi:hypothetical protein